MKKKTLTIAIALVLVVALAVGATYAYLTATTKAVKNTFVAGGAVDQNDLNLYEHNAVKGNDGTYTLGTEVLDGSEGKTGNKYTVMPGVNLPKDPTVEVTKAEGPYYLFVEVTKGNGFKGEKAPLSYTVTSNWVALQIDGREVYAYKTADGTVPAILNGKLDATQILAPTANTTDAADNTITVANADLSNVNCELTFQAYACQAAGFADATAAFNACFGK